MKFAVTAMDGGQQCWGTNITQDGLFPISDGFICENMGKSDFEVNWAFAPLKCGYLFIYLP